MFIMYFHTLMCVWWF